MAAGSAPSKPRAWEIKLADERIDDAHRIVFADVVDESLPGLPRWKRVASFYFASSEEIVGEFRLGEVAEHVAELGFPQPCRGKVKFRKVDRSSAMKNCQGLLSASAILRLRISNGSSQANTARGGLVDEAAVGPALDAGHIGGAAFDVTSVEPPPTGHPFLELLHQPDFILTPHVAWASDEAVQSLADQLVDNIEAFVRGNPRNLVTA